MTKNDIIALAEQFVKESPKNYISKDDALSARLACLVRVECPQGRFVIHFCKILTDI